MGFSNAGCCDSNSLRGVFRWRVLNGIFRVLRSGAPWADRPERYGPCTTCYNRFRRWTKAGIWGRHHGCRDGGSRWQYSDDRRYQRARGRHKKSHPDRYMGRNRGGLTTKIHAVTDASGLPIRLALTAGETRDAVPARELLSGLQKGQIILADRPMTPTGSGARSRIKGQCRTSPAPHVEGLLQRHTLQGPRPDRALAPAL